MAPIIRTCSGVAIALAAVPAAARDDPAATYLKARLAESRGDVATALAGYRSALARAPEPAVALRAYREGLRAGDFTIVRRALDVLERAKAAPGDAALVRLADAALSRRAGDIDTALGRLRQSPFAFLAPSVEVWRAPGSDPAAAAANAGTDALVRRFAAPTRGLLLLAAGRTTEAQPILGALPGGSAEAARWAAARILAGRGDRAGATATLGRDPGPGAQPTLAFGVGFLFQALLDEISEDRGGPVPVALARLALRVQPDDDRARVLLARQLARSGAVASADEVLDRIRVDSPFASAARDLRVEAAGADEVERARALAERPQATAADQIRLGDRLMAAGRFANAAAAYRRADNGSDAMAALRLGGALDKAGRWDEAKPYFARALTLAPADPNVLNSVGYARVERGEDLTGSLALLEEALAARPDSAAILDSVGWARLRSGDPAGALVMLERAVAIEPEDSVINAHLGDTYWTLGRRYEARYAWRAATIGADDATQAGLAARIANGLPAS